MRVVEFVRILIERNTEVIFVWGAILIGFACRVYFMSRGTWEYSRETARKKLTGIILFMIVLSLCFDAELFNLSTKLATSFGGFAAAAYFVIAVVASFDRDDPINNNWVSIAKFALIYLTAMLSSNVLILVISVLAAVGMIFLYRMGFINKDRKKFVFAEITLLCIENFLISVLTLCFVGTESIYSTITKVVFEETVLYSINYIVLFMVEDKIYGL